MRIAIIGAGYVGLTSGVALAYLGHNVTCIDRNKELINRLKKGEATIHEQGLSEFLFKTKDRLSFSSKIDDNIASADVIIIAVGTPSKSNGDADLSQLAAVVEMLAGFLKPGFHPVIVNKSTLPVGTAKFVRALLERSFAGDKVVNFSVASNPEFLREGTAINDFLYPDRIVLGVEDSIGAKRLQDLYRSIISQDFTAHHLFPRPNDYHRPELMVTDCCSAELIKYSANAFLALKISFINELSGLAERLGININEVSRGIGLDKRIGNHYLKAGVGWGGSCLGKDIHALSYIASQYGYDMPLLVASTVINKRQRKLVITKLQEVLKVLRGKTVGIMGISFKPLTDDLRDAPAIDIMCDMLDMGVLVKAYDPVAMDNFRKHYGYLRVECVNDALTLAQGSDALVIVTDWAEFKELPWGKLGRIMRQRILIDGRNMLHPTEMESIGFIYRGVGQ